MPDKYQVRSLGVNLTNILRMAFFVQKGIAQLFLVTFQLCNFWHQNFVQKHTLKMLMKLMVGVNLTNILQAAFLYKLFFTFF
jgi:hypothetical protein